MPLKLQMTYRTYHLTLRALKARNKAHHLSRMYHIDVDLAYGSHTKVIAVVVVVYTFLFQFDTGMNVVTIHKYYSMCKVNVYLVPKEGNANCNN